MAASESNKRNNNGRCIDPKHIYIFNRIKTTTTHPFFYCISICQNEEQCFVVHCHNIFPWKKLIFFIYLYSILIDIFIVIGLQVVPKLWPWSFESARYSDIFKQLNAVLRGYTIFIILNHVSSINHLFWEVGDTEDTFSQAIGGLARDPFVQAQTIPKKLYPFVGFRTSTYRCHLTPISYLAWRQSKITTDRFRGQKWIQRKILY